MREEKHPTLAENGFNVLHDGLVVQAAAQLEDDEKDAEDAPAGYPADVPFAIGKRVRDDAAALETGKGKTKQSRQTNMSFAALGQPG